MTILYVTDALAVKGGLERVLIEKANALAANEADQIVLVTANQGERAVAYPLHSRVRLADLNIQFHRQYDYRGFRRLRELRRLHRLFRFRLRAGIAEVRPDVIVCMRADFLSDLLKVRQSVPLVFESHSSFWTSRFEGAGLLRRLHTLWMNLQARHAQAVVALTNGDASVWRKVNRQVFVIPNIVHLNASRTYSDCLSKSVVFVGRLARQKDVGSLLAVWRIVLQKHPDWQLHVYGDWEHRDASLCRMLEAMHECVIVHPAVDDITDVYKNHSILLLTSLFEPFGLVLPEAMSCGLPVVAFDCPYGPADIITDGVDGFLIKDRSIEAFAEKVCLLMDNPDLRRRMGEAGVRSAQRYTSDRLIPMWRTLFESQAACPEE